MSASPELGTLIALGVVGATASALCAGSVLLVLRDGYGRRPTWDDYDTRRPDGATPRRTVRGAAPVPRRGVTVKSRATGPGEERSGRR